VTNKIHLWFRLLAIPFDKIGVLGKNVLQTRQSLFSPAIVKTCQNGGDRTCQDNLWHLVYSISIPMQYIYILWPWNMLFRRINNWIFTYLRCLETLSLSLLRQRNTQHLTTIVFQWELICGHMSYRPDISLFIYRLFMDSELDNIRNYVRSLFQLSALCQWSERKCCFNLLLVQCSLNFGASNSADTVCELLDLNSLSPCI
jgi:hypothetical protein